MNNLWVLIVSLVFVFLLAGFIRYVQSIDYDPEIVPDISTDPNIEAGKRVDCSLGVVYCFENNNCSSVCTIASSAVCRNGICLNSNVINTTAPINECDAERGVVTFFAGNVALGRYDYLCRSIDLGIAPDDVSLPNNMCKDGDIDINYLVQFPDIRQCQCPPGTSLVGLPATSQVRQYGQCLDTRLADQIGS